MSKFDDLSLDITPKGLDANSKFPFGKYLGARLEEVPASYMLWLFEQEWLRPRWPSMYEYIKRNLVAITREVEEEKGSRKDRHTHICAYDFRVDDSDFIDEFGPDYSLQTPNLRYLDWLNSIDPGNIPF